MNLLRHEDQRLITGQGRFTADWQVDGQLHAAMVRSDRAHANITSIDLAAAKAMPGVELILTAADVEAAGFGSIPSGPDIVGKDGMQQHKAPLPLLASDCVRYVGQPIAMVIAQTALMARDAAEQVLVDYEELPAISTVAAALAPNAQAIHASADQNTSLLYEAGDAEAVEKAFANAARTSTLKIVSQRLYGAPMEPRACMASHDTASNLTRVYTPTQGMLGMRASLCAVTQSEPEQIEVISQDVGGSFGLRGSTYPEQALTVLASRKLGQAVKWVGSRSELFVGEWHGRSLTLEGSIALDANNKITAIRFNDEVDLGAYNCYFGGFIGTNNLSVTMGGVYQVPALHMQSRLIYTNTSPVSAYRGAGRPDIAFAIERLIDHCAAEHGLDRVAFRRQNFVPEDAFPYTTANGTVYDCGNFGAVLSKTLELADYEGFANRRSDSAAKGMLRGIGFGCYVEKSGAGGAPKDQVSCRFHRDGRLVLHAVSGSSGQGHETSFAQIVGEGLGIDPAGIFYKAGDPSLTLIGNGTGGSRSLYGTGSAFKNLVTSIIDNARAHAAKALGVSEDSVKFDNGEFLGGGKRLSLVALAEQLATDDPAEHPLNAEAETSTGANFPNGCHLAEIELDPQTGQSRVVNYVAVDDLGHVVSPTLVRGQVHGGVVQGYGQAFTEQVVYDEETGQLLSGSFMDYAMPRAGSIENIRCEWENVPTSLNELGAKGVGESGCSGSLPAISNAMMDALASAGAGPMDMPYTPARVWAALKASA
ncbi:MAG: xanthine dehydrogenase family protein molybdopterin-binding subunit [Burkholderiaceae bacterium]